MNLELIAVLFIFTIPVMTTFLWIKKGEANEQAASNRPNPSDPSDGRIRVAVLMAVVVGIVIIVLRLKALDDARHQYNQFQRVGSVINANASSSLTPANEWKATSRVKMDNYLMMREGMDYFDALALVGSGKEISRSGFGDIDITMYQWSNPDGSNIIATFQNGRLILKAQVGIP